MTRDDYVDAVGNLIIQNDRSGVGIKASTLGNMILRSVSDHWQQHGFRQLKDLLVELEKRDVIDVLKDSLGGLTAVTRPAQPAPAVATTPTRATPLWRLRKICWAAFVNTLPRGRRFLNRATGNVLMGQTDSPGEGWVEIKPVSDEKQRGWVNELSEIAQLPEVRSVLDSETWFARMADVLRASHPDLLIQWNLLRSARVAECVRKWCEHANVQASLVFEVPGASPVAKVERQPDDLRQRVLDALALMSTDELLAIPIPAKYLLGDKAPNSR